VVTGSRLVAPLEEIHLCFLIK